MAYSTAANVRQALVPSSDGSQPTGDALTHTAADLSDDQLGDAIAEADATLDGYLSGRYVTPVAQVDSATPHPIDYWSRDIAAYLATLSYRGSLDFTDQDPVARRYSATMDQLKAVSSGKMNLPLPSNTGAESGAAQGAGTPANPYTGTLWGPDDFHLGTGGWQENRDLNGLW